MSRTIAVVGAGYWGPNLVRNFTASPDWDLVAVCDIDAERAAAVVGPRSTTEVETSLDRLLARPDLDAVAVATPARTHHAIARQALRAGKHVLVEKPLAESRGDALDLIETAAAQGLVLMTDHTYCYTPVVGKIAELVADGTLGEVLYLDSVRINLGLVQPDVDVFWDLAPHDLSIFDAVLPGGLRPVSVAAHGSDPLGTGRACIGYLTMHLPGGQIAHVHVNWLSPTKVRRMVIGGSRRTLVWDDLDPAQRLTVFDRGVELGDASSERRTAAQVGYRLGDVWSPSLPEREALAGMVREFAAAVEEGRPPLTDAHAGLRVLSVLEDARRSLAEGGARVRSESDEFAAVFA